MNIFGHESEYCIKNNHTLKYIIAMICKSFCIECKFAWKRLDFLEMIWYTTKRMRETVFLRHTIKREVSYYEKNFNHRI